MYESTTEILNAIRCSTEFLRLNYSKISQLHFESGGALIAIDSKTQRMIVSSRFLGYDRQQFKVEIGWTFQPRSHWCVKFNEEMQQLMLQHAFQFVNSVIFLMDPHNLYSQRAKEKSCGVRTLITVSSSNGYKLCDSTLHGGR